MHQFQCLIYEFLTYFGQWRKGYMYASKLSEIIAIWNYVLEANSEFGDSNLVLLMNVGIGKFSNSKCQNSEAGRCYCGC